MDQPQLNEITTGEYVCTNCFLDFDAPKKKKRTFLGFCYKTCPHCGDRVFMVLSTSEKIANYIVLALLGAISILILLNGAIPLPGILAVIAIMSLTKDVEHKKKIALAWEENREELASLKGEPPTPPME